MQARRPGHLWVTPFDDQQLGKGTPHTPHFSLIINHIYLGVINEIFMVIHFKSGLIQVAKVIKKSNIVNGRQLVRETKMLKKLVFFFGF